jgi:DnaJ-class molecular chaperone
MEYRDYYATLGVDRSASQDEIRKAYRRLARENHPDVKPGDTAAEQRFKDLNEANTVLSDPEKRRKYDAFGKDWASYAASGAGGQAGGDPFGPGGPFAGMFRGAGARGTEGQNVRYEFRTSDDPGFSDFFRVVFGDGGFAGATPGAGSGRRATAAGAEGIGFEDAFGGMPFGAPEADRAGARRARTRATPVEATAELSLEEAYHGATRRVAVDGKRLEVTIPRGVDTGTRIRLSGQGGGGRDLVVVCRVRPHPTFTRRGVDLEREVPITLEEATLGAEIQIETLKGRVVLTVPAGTQPGRTFRLAGQGMPRFKGDGHGDLRVRIKVIVPTDLGDDARAAAARFFELANQPNPRTN